MSVPPSELTTTPANVVIIAHTHETLDSLEDHMRTAGLAARRSRSLGRWPEIASGACALAVLFPDEFPNAPADAALDDLDMNGIAVIVVTGDPRRFDHWQARDHLNHVLLPKPVWSWNLIDSIRSWLLLSERCQATPSCR